MPGITTEWRLFEQLSPIALYEVLSFRQSIFVVEQRSPYPDLDGLDQNAWHLQLRAGSDLGGYLRLVPGPPLLRLGRVAVATHLRRRGLGRLLVSEALRFCRGRFPAEPILAGVQLYLVPFYGRFGFEATGEPYDDFGVAHVEMTLQRTA